MKLPPRGVDAGLDAVRAEIGRLDAELSIAERDKDYHAIHGITARQARLMKFLKAYMARYRAMMN